MVLKNLIRKYLEYKIAKFLFKKFPLKEGKKVLLLLNDKLGDAVLRLKLLSYYQKTFNQNFLVIASEANYLIYKLVLKNNNLIIFNHKDFKKSLKRWKLIKKLLTQYDIATVINPFSSRPVYVDYFIRDIKIKNKIGYEGELNCVIDHYYDKFYTFLVPCIEKKMNWKEKLPHVLFYELEIYNFITKQTLSFNKIVPQRDDLLKSVLEKKISIPYPQLLQIPYIVICLGAGSKKRIYPIYKWGKIIKHLLQTYKNYFLLFVGNFQEKSLYKDLEKHVSPTEKVINLIGKTDIYTLIYILSNAKLFIGNDTGVSHIASILRIPTIVLYPLADYGKFMNDFIPTTYYIYCSKYINCKICGWKCKHPLKNGILLCVYDISEDQIISIIEKLLEKGV